MHEIIKFIVIVTSLITLLYPIIMSIIWLSGGIIYNYKRSKSKKLDLTIEEQFFDIVIPVFNEGAAISEYITNNINLNYNNYRLIIIDDCSSDDTYEHIKNTAKTYGNKIVIYHMPKNMGKAKVLNYAITNLVTSDYFLCVDSDAIIDIDALKYLNAHIKTSNIKHSAITGYPNLLNTSNDIIHISQQVEYRSIIGMIKKAQANFGSIMTVSGVCTAYKTNDIKAIGLFDTTNATEDIEITWRLQRNNYKVYFLSEMIVKMYSPDYVHELLIQRARWTLGGLQTFIKNRDLLLTKNHTMLKLFLVEALLSCIWTFCFMISTIFIAIMALFRYPVEISVTHIIMVFLLMFFVSFIYLLSAYLMEVGPKESPFKFFKVLLFYPFIYWFIYPIGYLMGSVKFIKIAIFKNKNASLWRSEETNKNFNKALKIRYIFSLLYDFLIFIISFSLIRSLLLTYIAPNISSQWQYLIFVILFNILYALLVLYLYIYLPLKIGATPGKRLLGIMQVKKSGSKVNALQLYINPIILVFTSYLILRFSFLIAGLTIFSNGEDVTFYSQLSHMINFSAFIFYLVLLLLIFLVIDALLCNVILLVTKTKIVKAEKIQAQTSAINIKTSKQRKIMYVVIYLIIFILFSSIFIYSTAIKIQTLYPTINISTNVQE